MSPLVKMNALEELEGWVAERPMHGMSKEVFSPGTWEYAHIGDHLYQIPLDATNYQMVVRDDFLKEAGLSLTDITTWSQFIEACEALTVDQNGDGKIDRYGFLYPTGAHRYAWRQAEIMALSNGFTPDEVEKESQYLELFNFMKEFQPYMAPSTIVWELKDECRAFALGKTAMALFGNWFANNVVSLNKEVIQHSRSIPFPLGPSGTKYQVPLNAGGYSMFKASRHKEEAWRFIAYICSPANALVWCASITLPARLDIDMDELKTRAGKYFPGVEKANAQLIDDFMYSVENYSYARKKIPARVQMEKVFVKEISPFLQGKVSAEMTYKAIKEGIEPLK